MTCTPQMTKQTPSVPEGDTGHRARTGLRDVQARLPQSLCSCPLWHLTLSTIGGQAQNLHCRLTQGMALVRAPLTTAAPTAAEGLGLTSVRNQEQLYFLRHHGTLAAVSVEWHRCPRGLLAPPAGARRCSHRAHPGAPSNQQVVCGVKEWPGVVRNSPKE